MKIEELRIGNIVRVTADIANQFYGGLLPIRQPTYDIIISGISDESIFYGKPDRIWNKAEVNIKDIYPIPITEELLLNIGFEKLDNSFTHNDYRVDIGYINDFWLIHIKGDMAYNGEAKKCLRYLHELQNLFYALTGEEL